MKVETVTPGDHLGDVIGDINRRRGMIQEQFERGTNIAVVATVPLSEMFGYIGQLRGMTSGRALVHDGVLALRAGTEDGGRRGHRRSRQGEGRGQRLILPKGERNRRSPFSFRRKSMSKIQEASLKDLHPTQLTVGLIVVQDKSKHLPGPEPADRQSFMKAHPMPAVIGPKGTLYITDHHHLGRAALEAAVPTGFFEVEADLSKCSTEPSGRR